MLYLELISCADDYAVQVFTGFSQSHDLQTTSIATLWHLSKPPMHAYDRSLDYRVQ